MTAEARRRGQREQRFDDLYEIELVPIGHVVPVADLQTRSPERASLRRRVEHRTSVPSRGHSAGGRRET
jgi:hypothetical protein